MHAVKLKTNLKIKEIKKKRQKKNKKNKLEFM